MAGEYESAEKHALTEALGNRVTFWGMRPFLETASLVARASTLASRDFLSRGTGGDEIAGASTGAVTGRSAEAFTERSPEAVPRSLAERALQLDPFVAEAHATLAWTLHWQYKRQQALAEFERARALNPNL